MDQIERRIGREQALEDRVERLEDGLRRIAQWADAYPLVVFPEPDEAALRRAGEALAACGMTIDGISAPAMRHVIQGVGEIARRAIAVD